MYEYTLGCIDTLLKKGINTTDENGKTPLMLAAWIGDEKLVESLLKQGADTTIVDKIGKTVLSYASQQKNIKILQIISEDKNIDLNYRDNSGYRQTALFTPAEVENIPILTILLKAGADPNILDKNKMTALQWAAQQGKTESIKLLLEYDADVNTKNNKGITPLMSACLVNASKENVGLLLNAGAVINEQNKKGETALFLAAYYGHEDIVEFLLAKGADKNLQDKKGFTAYTIAEKNKKYNVLNILENFKTCK